MREPAAVVTSAEQGATGGGMDPGDHGREGVDEGPQCGAGGRGLEPRAAAEERIPGEHGNGRARMQGQATSIEVFIPTSSEEHDEYFRLCVKISPPFFLGHFPKKTQLYVPILPPI